MPYQTLFSYELLCSSASCDFYANFPVKIKQKIEKYFVNANLSLKVMVVKYFSSVLGLQM